MNQLIDRQRSDPPHTVAWRLIHERLVITLLRTVLLGLLAGFVVASLLNQTGTWPQWTLFALWFTFGGHWVELFFLNWLRPRLPPVRWVQVAGRVVTWLIGGTLLLAGAGITLRLFGWPAPYLPWWLGGVGLLGLELVMHGLIALRGRPNFYNGLS